MIGFFNWPFVQFVLDVAMVVVYAFAVFTAEGLTQGATSSPAVFPEALLVFISFVLYVAWDQVGVRLKKSSEYEKAWNDAKTSHQLGPYPKHDWTSTKRCGVTWLFTALSFIAALVALWVDRRFERPAIGTIIGINAALWSILLGFRFFKEAVTPRQSQLP